MLFLRIVSGFLVVLCAGNLPAATRNPVNPQKPLEIHVARGAFGRVSSADLTQLLRSTGDEIWRYCPEVRLSSIEVYHRLDHPQINLKKTAEGRIAIGLATQQTLWAQYSFQFSHEFCHAVANYGNNQRLLHSPHGANLWLEESLCETASLFTLRAMSRSWQTTPPFPAWKNYAPFLNSYVEERLKLPQHRLPAGTSFSAWFRKNQHELRRDPHLRGPNTIIARQLLPLFEAEPEGWAALVFLNDDSAPPNRSLEQHFASWKTRSPGEFHPFISRLAAVFRIPL